MPDKKLIKELKSKIEAIVIAIPREVEAYELYMELADQHEEAAAKEMFLFLAKQEMAHKDMLERILGELQQKLDEAMK